MSRLPGIIETKASYREGNVVVQYDSAAVTSAQIAETIAAETYYTVGEPVVGGEFAGDGGRTNSGATAVIRVEGMTDDRTASLVTQSIGVVGPAISDVSLDVAGSTLTVVYDPDEISAEAMIDAINRGTEYKASLISMIRTGGAGVDDGVDYTPYVVLGIGALFVAALAWPAVSWGRRQFARATPSRAARRRRARRRRR